METTSQVQPTTQQPTQALQESKAPIQISGGYYDGQTWGVMKMMAQTFWDSGAFPAVKVAEMMVRLQAGRELGLMPIESVKYIAVINGRPSLWGEKAIELVISAGHRVEWGLCNEKTATCTITRKDTAQTMTQTFTMDMANARGLTKKGGSWISSPDNMLKFKAFHAIAKFLVPDALRGASIAEIEESEGQGPMAAAAVAASTGLAAQADAGKTKLKPLAERVAEKEKFTVIDGVIPTEQAIVKATVKPVDEPVYEPIAPAEPPTPVIQVDSPLPPPKPTEGVAARKMREAAEKTKAAKSPNEF